MASPDANALMARLKAAAPPANPGTPENRVNPRAEYLEGLARVRKSLETLLEKIDDQSQPLEKTMFGAMHYATMKLLAGVDAQAVASTMGQSLGTPNPPGAPGTAPQAAPQAPGGAPAGPPPGLVNAIQAGLGGAA